jgi:hypothetical protein
MTYLSSFSYFGSNFGLLEEASTMKIMTNLRYFWSDFDICGAALNDDVSVQF